MLEPEAAAKTTFFSPPSISSTVGGSVSVSEGVGLQPPHSANANISHGAHPTPGAESLWQRSLKLLVWRRIGLLTVGRARVRFIRESAVINRAGGVAKSARTTIAVYEAGLTEIQSVTPTAVAVGIGKTSITAIVR